jgi:hypothetical protein
MADIVKLIEAKGEMPKFKDYKSLTAFYNDYQSLLDKYKKDMANPTQSIKAANDWYRDAAQQVVGITGNDIMRDAKRRQLIPITSLDPRFTGRMIMFFYNPKYRETLPHYDMFPLVLPIKFYTGKSAGFLGLNLHYLPMNLRVQFLENLYQIYKNKHLDEGQKLNLSYRRLNSTAKLSLFQPCLHRYLYKADNGGGVKSRFYLVDPNEWNKMVALPTERFMGNTKERVWKESRKKLGL